MDLKIFKGARALTIMHEKEVRQFVATWEKAKATRVVPHESKNPDYLSMETLLRHVFFWGRKNMIWICENLGLPDPQIQPTPEPETIETEIEHYMSHYFEQFAKPLVSVPAKALYYPTYKSLGNPLVHNFFDVGLSKFANQKICPETWHNSIVGVQNLEPDLNPLHPTTTHCPNAIRLLFS